MRAVDLQLANQHPATMFRALLLSIGDLRDPAVARVLAKSLAITLALFVLLGIGLFFLLDGWAGHALSAFAAAALTLLAGWLLFRIVAIPVVQAFGDRIVAAVEARHYPTALATARPAGAARTLRMGLGSAVRALVANLAMLPIYVILLFTAIGPAIAFFLVNAWLLGRDLGDMAASRHLDDAAMRAWRRASAGRRFVLGLVVTGLFVVPFVNLLAPILGAAMATHLFHGGRR